MSMPISFKLLVASIPSFNEVLRLPQQAERAGVVGIVMLDVSLITAAHSSSELKTSFLSLCFASFEMK